MTRGVLNVGLLNKDKSVRCDVQVNKVQGEYKVFPWLQTFVTRKLLYVEYKRNCDITINTWHKILESNLSIGKKICLYST